MASGFADKPPRGAGDVDLYQAEIQRISLGEGYYEAASHELHERGYPTRSIFNWRTPLPMWLLGILPGVASGRVIIGGLAAMLLALSIHVTARESNSRRAVLCGLTMIGALLPCWLEKIYVMPVVWAGVLIALSICAYAMQRVGWGLGLGLSALFVRELAAPYCAICFLIAATNRRWRKCIAWLVGFGAFAIFYARHALQVMSFIGLHDRVHAEGWLQFGGAAFAISLAQMNVFLLLLPQWIAAVYLPLALLGFAGLNTPTGQRAGLTACAFIIMFAFIGQPFNQYWGSLLAPLLCFGFAQSPAAIVDLIRRSQLVRKSPGLAGANI